VRKKVNDVDVFICDRFNCGEQENVGHGDSMFEIIFGVHTDIHTALNKKGRSMPIIQGVYCFCPEHYLEAGEGILNLIVDCSSTNFDKICTKAEFVEGLGCWITINNRIDSKEIKNFQFPFWVFEKIHEMFLKSLKNGFKIDEQNNREKIEKLRNMP
jgi:hypothetical protein